MVKASLDGHARRAGIGRRWAQLWYIDSFAKLQEAHQYQATVSFLRISREQLPLDSPCPVGDCANGGRDRFSFRARRRLKQNTARSSASPRTAHRVCAHDPERTPGPSTSLLHYTVEMLEHEEGFLSLDTEAATP